MDYVVVQSHKNVDRVQNDSPREHMDTATESFCDATKIDFVPFPKMGVCFSGGWSSFHSTWVRFGIDEILSRELMPRLFCLTFFGNC
jgi:hypothetical protein